MKKICTLIVILIVFNFCKPVIANYEISNLKEIGVLEEQEHELNSRVNEINREIADLNTTESALEKQLKEMETTMTSTISEIERINEQIWDLTKNIESLRKNFNDYQEKIDKRKQLIKERMRVLQENDGVLQYLTFLFESESFTDFLERGYLVAKMLETDQLIVHQLKNDEQRLKLQQQILDEKRNELSQLERNYAEQLNNIEKQKLEKSLVLDQLKDKIKKSIETQDRLLEQSKQLNEKKQLYNNQNINTSNISNNNHDFPLEYLQFYIEAGQKYQVDWFIISAIHSIETDFSRHPSMISSKGAIGHMQFLKLTWVGYKYDDGNGQVPDNLDITDLAVIKEGKGYGTDMNNDGIADPFDIQDSIGSAARYLSEHGYSSNPAKAIWHYNHARWYVDEVFNEARRIKELIE